LEPATGADGEPEPGIVRLSPSAKAAWIRFYNEHAQEHVDLSGDLSAAWSKLEGYAARLALVVHLVRWAAGDTSLAGCDVVDETSVAAGVALSRWFGQETRRVYGLLNEAEEDRQRRELVELVQRLGGRVTARDLMKHSRAYPTAEVAERALAELGQAGLGRWEDAGPTAQGGRPTRFLVLANAVDVDTTPKTLEKPGVVSTEPFKASIPAVPNRQSDGSAQKCQSDTSARPAGGASKAQNDTCLLPVPAAYPPPPVDKTPELPKESEVVSTSTLSTPAISPRPAANLDGDTPGPTDLLTPEQYATYKAIYYSRPAGMSPTEKHARAWRAALRRSNHEAQN
jgi:hypothetical protein